MCSRKVFAASHVMALLAGKGALTRPLFERIKGPDRFNVFFKYLSGCILVRLIIRGIVVMIKKRSQRLRGRRRLGSLISSETAKTRGLRKNRHDVTTGSVQEPDRGAL
ncbi:MAG: hypothetical protein Ct9H300mP8_04230 [Gammaproteobacteria bacterium]|nr:MAG: hypothetical protein Ct9H300mP8_04230 [Gammaproteobacteria bacterium]